MRDQISDLLAEVCVVASIKLLSVQPIRLKFIFQDFNQLARSNFTAWTISGRTQCRNNQVAFANSRVFPLLNESLGIPKRAEV